MKNRNGNENVNIKSQSDNYSKGDMHNTEIGGDINNVVQNINQMVQQVHVQAPPPEVAIEQLDKSLNTNRLILNKYKSIFLRAVIENEKMDDLKYIAVMRNIVTAIKNIEILIPNITLKGGRAEFQEGETDPLKLLVSIIEEVESVRYEIIEKDPVCPYCEENFSVEDEYDGLVLSVDTCPRGVLFYSQCEQIEEINGMAVSSVEKCSCSKCKKPCCMYIATKYSLTNKISEIINDKMQL